MSKFVATVSERAQQGFDQFVASAVKHSLVQAGTDCVVQETAEPPTKDGKGELVMLTVSSYLFRVLLFMHFDRSPAQRAHYAALAKVGAEAMDDERFVDEVMERGNLVCGALNRDLATFYPHIGMSTPCMLKHSSVEHIGTIKPAFTRRYRAEVGPGVAMHFTLAVCAFADLDFAFEPSAAEAVEDTSGELELF